MLKLSIIICVVILTSGCASTVKVELADVKISTTTHKLIGRAGPSNLVDKKTDVIQFDITSKEELHKFFVVERKKPIQVLCRADGVKRNGGFSNFGYGPFYDGEDISMLIREEGNSVNFIPNTKDGEFKYTIFAFLDLEAGYTQLHYGIPETALDLKNEQFDKLICYIRGFAYPPLIPPRSNEFGIDQAEFMKILGKHKEELN